MNPLVVVETVRTLRIARAGRLRSWLGPALRGLAGGRLRARVCQLPVVEQVTRWKYCRGCPHMIGCAYGETVEPDPPPGVHLAAGWENTARPLVVAPAYPLPDVGQPGFAFPVRVVFIGRAAAGHAGVFWEALRVGGADPLLGLGEDRVLFDVLPPDDPADTARTEEVVLPPDPTAVPGVIPWVWVGVHHDRGPGVEDRDGRTGRTPVRVPVGYQPRHPSHADKRRAWQWELMSEERGHRTRPEPRAFSTGMSWKE